MVIAKQLHTMSKVLRTPVSVTKLVEGGGNVQFGENFEKAITWSMKRTWTRRASAAGQAAIASCLVCRSYGDYNEVRAQGSEHCAFYCQRLAVETPVTSSFRIRLREVHISVNRNVRYNWTFLHGQATPQSQPCQIAGLRPEIFAFPYHQFVMALLQVLRHMRIEVGSLGGVVKCGCEPKFESLDKAKIRYRHETGRSHCFSCSLYIISNLPLFAFEIASVARLDNLEEINNINRCHAYPDYDTFAPHTASEQDTNVRLSALAASLQLTVINELH